MKLQVLLSVMHQKDHSILNKTNIQTSAIVINQSDTVAYEKFKYKDKLITFISAPERGVGRSRNMALMQADADIVIFADQDIEYVDGYDGIIITEFQKNKKADIILFNVPSLNKNRPTNINKTDGRVRRYNCLRYGAVSIAVRLDKVRNNDIYFSLLFGGGAKYSSGEDSLFLYRCIQNGLKVYRSTSVIAHVKQEESSWFNGYDKQFFVDKGVFFAILSERHALFFAIQYAIRKRHLYSSNFTITQVIRFMLSGMQKVKRCKL